MLEVFQVLILTLILPVTLSVFLAHGIFCLMDFLGAQSAGETEPGQEAVSQVETVAVRKAS